MVPKGNTSTPITRGSSSSDHAQCGSAGQAQSICVQVLGKEELRNNTEMNEGDLSKLAQPFVVGHMHLRSVCGAGSCVSKVDCNGRN